jgi:hypothetical protein
LLAGLCACAILTASAAEARGVREIHTPAILGNSGWCSVTNLSSETTEVTIRIVDLNGVVLNPLGSPLETTVALDPGHTKALQGFAEQDEALLMRCVVETEARAFRKIEVSFCNHPNTAGLPGAIACVQRR